MSKIYPSAKAPIGMPVDSAIYYDGEILKATTAPRLGKVTAKGDAVVAVVDQDTLTAKGDAKTVPAGYKLGAWRLGCGEIVWIKSVINQTYTPGCVIYADDAVDGQVTATPATSRPVGHYPEWMSQQVTAAAGEKVPCILDVPVGTATVAGG